MRTRDTWCLRGGQTPGIGRFVYIRKAFTALSSWLFETTNFKDVVEIEAIVDAPWVRLCTSNSFYWKWVGIIAYTYFAGPFTIARSTTSGFGRPLRAE